MAIELPNFLLWIGPGEWLLYDPDTKIMGIGGPGNDWDHTQFSMIVED